MAASPPERPGAEAALAPPSLPDGASWSLHRRLALGLVLSIGGVFLLLFAVLEHWIDREIYRRMDEGLQQRASVVARLLQEPGAQPLAQWLPEYASQGHTEFFTVFERDAVAAAPLLHSAMAGLEQGGATASRVYLRAKEAAEKIQGGKPSG